MVENVTKAFSDVFFQAFLTFTFFISQLRRIKAVTNTHRELPPITMGRSVDEFFVVLDQDSAQGKILPNWWVNMFHAFSMSLTGHV